MLNWRNSERAISNVAHISFVFEQGRLSSRRHLRLAVRQWLGRGFSRSRHDARNSSRRTLGTRVERAGNAPADREGISTATLLVCLLSIKQSASLEDSMRKSAFVVAVFTAALVSSVVHAAPKQPSSNAGAVRYFSLTGYLGEN